MVEGEGLVSKLVHRASAVALMSVVRGRRRARLYSVRARRGRCPRAPYAPQIIFDDVLPQNNERKMSGTSGK